MPVFRGLIAITFIAANTVVWCVPIYLLAIPRALIPIAPIRTFIGSRMTRVIDAWVSGNRLLIRALDLTRIRVEINVDEPLRRDQWHMVVSNHQGWSDILVLQDSFLARIAPLKFFVKRQLIWVPLLGPAMWLLGFPYVRRYSRDALAANPSLRRHDQEATQRACEVFKERPTSVLNFMEGTRFSAQKHAHQQSKYRNLLMPKTGGFGYVLGSLGDRVQRILDVTIVYPSGPPSFWHFICGRCREVRVDVKARPVPAGLEAPNGDLPPDARQQLREWIDELWSSKDVRIDDLRRVS